MKIATFNVNSIRSRLHIVLPWLRANRPDYFCMQETKVADAGFPAAEFESLGYNAVFKGDKQYKGVAIVSKQKPQKVTYGFDSEPADADRMIIAQYHDLTIVNTYVPQGQEMGSEQFAYKLKWLDRFKKYLQKNFQPRDEVIWCGDLNIAPEPIDVHDPKRLLGHVCFNPEVWKVFEDIKSWGLTDVFRKHYPGVAGQYWNRVCRTSRPITLFFTHNGKGKK